MVLGPKGNERLGNPAADRRQAVQPGMATGAKRDQKSRGVLPRLPVMDMEAIPRPAGPAAARIPFEDGFAVPGKVRTRMSAGAIAAGAETGDGGSSLSANTEQSSLAMPSRAAARRNESPDWG